ncbi:hypothetical protein AWB72_03012 [Caballeronia concitans]|uniref:Three-Cys-motif partner protein TcmP n=2 Tax=Caballeronia concitans TaxID=1777133 RepID=A0A658QYD9_9BURK|nr:hypothetical protein BurMR1_1708 [Burkholderia sp. MR1]SAL32866.1 hypothetical protein AWB72_03012 [Caballeronia concitans]
MDAMVVGSWSGHKHDMLVDYVGASRGARMRWPHASYIDLFCGPGRVVERQTNAFRDGGALAAWKASCANGGPSFSDVFIGDLDQRSVEFCRKRLETFGACVHAYVGAASETVHRVICDLPRGLNLAFLDPFSAEHLDFEIILALSRLNRIDILVHFSVMDIQRNIEREAVASGARLERIAPGWREAIELSHLPKSAFINAFLDYWKALVERTANMTAADMMPLIKNSKNGPLYRLIMLKRHPLAEKLWNDVGRDDKAQKDLF